MASKKDIAELAKQVKETPGWTVSNNATGHWVFTRDSTGESTIVSSTPSSASTLPNVKAELRRMGWNPDAAQIAKEEKRAAALEADRRRAAQLLAIAEKRAAANQAIAAEKAQLLAAEKAQLLADQAEQSMPDFLEIRLQEAEQSSKTPTIHPAKNLVFIAPTTTPEVHVPFSTPKLNLGGYRSELVYATKAWAEAATEKRQCRQRKVYDANVAKIRRAIEAGKFLENPADHIIFDEHGCLVNGQHRAWSILLADDAKMAKHYPNGVPLYVTYDYPSAQVNVFDTGKVRSVSDALNVDGHQKFGSSHASALRLAMNYDHSFTLPSDDPLRPWVRWKDYLWTNEEFSEAAGSAYQELPSFDGLAQRLYKKAGIARTAGTVAGFLLDRDNPDGGQMGTNEEFWDGVCFEVTLEPGDPRGALYRYFQNQRAQKNRPTVLGPLHLAHVLRQYANWQLGLSASLSNVNNNWPMPPVWQPGFRWINGDLRAARRSGGKKEE